MRLLGAEPGPSRRLLPWLVTLGVLLALAAVALWGRQQDAARRSAEGRADVAEAQLVLAQASLTTARAQAAASATAVAQASQPGPALERALSLVFEAYKDPTDAHLRALADAFSQGALAVERPEAEHLISAGTHLGGESTYELSILSTTPKGPDRAEVRTREHWTYDELDASNRRARCVREESEQTYTLHQTGTRWLVDEVQLSGAPRRTDC